MLAGFVPDPPVIAGFATLPDLLRLVAVPVIGWAAWRDHLTRRVPGRTWWPLVLLGAGLLAWEGLVAVVAPPPASRLFLLRAGLSVGLLVPLAVVFHRLHLVGGADAKAFVALAILFPTYPAYAVAGTVLPVVRPPLGVFSLTAVTNGALLGLAYPLVLALANLAHGSVSPAMLRARRVRWTALPETHGRVVETPDGRTLQGLDLDAIRMYLRWRRASLVDLRERPTALRDPSTLPDQPGDPTDGALDPTEQLDRDLVVEACGPEENPWTLADPWGAEAFLDAVGSAYGTTPAQLRDGLDLLSRADRVWVSPGLPYLVPVFAGLLLGLVYGDVLFAALEAIGVA